MRSWVTSFGFLLWFGASVGAETLPFQSPTYENIHAIRKAAPSGTVTIEGNFSFPRASDKVPAVVLLHTCIGPYSFDKVVGEHLRGAGFATLEFDSLKPRGWSATDSCGGRIPAGPWAQLGDAYAALKALARHPAIDPNRIAVVGGSMGGGTAFVAASEYVRRKLAEGFRFAAHVAFYPGGSNAVYGPGAFTGAPILIMLGERDDWTPAKRVFAVVDFLKQNDPALPIGIKTYDAYHSWIGTAARSYQSGRKSFADCPYVMMGVDDESVRNVLLSVNGETTPIPASGIGEVYRQCRTSGATTEGSRTVTETSLADLSRFLGEVFAR